MKTIISIGILILRLVKFYGNVELEGILINIKGKG